MHPPHRRSLFVSMMLAAAANLAVSSVAAADPAPYVDRVSHVANLKSEMLACATGPGRHCKAHRKVNADGTYIIAPHAGAPSGYGPPDIQSAYDIDSSLGAGTTVAIVDAYAYDAAEADLAVYRKQYGLPACTVASGCLKIVGSSGGRPPAGDDQGTGWNGESALDLDMVSAACPKCKILLILAVDASNAGLDEGQQTAATLGAAVVSDSWGGAESNPTSEEQYFQTRPPIGIFVASGDYGYNNGGQGPDYPSTSLFVIGVGGTTLKKSTSSPRGWTEAPWAQAGSSCSTAFAKPSYQTSFVSTTACRGRAASDISVLADNVATYQGGWQLVGGTSAASPLAAAMLAMTGHGSAKADFVYTNPTVWTDITITTKNGSCGAPMCAGAVGWDGPTGLGTPDVRKLAALGGGTPVPDMATPIPLDMATPIAPDMAMPIAPDMATSPGGGGGGGGSGGGGGGGSGGGGGGGSGGGGGGGSGGGGGGSGGGGTGDGWGCSMGGATDSTATMFPLGLALALLVFVARRRLRR
jgi:MYXO-CTERM domain-containing protein